MYVGGGGLQRLRVCALLWVAVYRLSSTTRWQILLFCFEYYFVVCLKTEKNYSHSCVCERNEKRRSRRAPFGFCKWINFISQAYYYYDFLLQLDCLQLRREMGRCDRHFAICWPYFIRVVYLDCTIELLFMRLDEELKMCVCPTVQHPRFGIYFVIFEGCFTTFFCVCALDFYMLFDLQKLCWTCPAQVMVQKWMVFLLGTCLNYYQ